MPGSNKGYWLPKIAGNRERDKRSARELRELGWRILIIWECQAADAMLLRRRLEKFLGTAVR
jgi:DNA mismatch endonuclease (patch repair protein)